jgi:hypothetical protein
VPLPLGVLKGRVDAVRLLNDIAAEIQELYVASCLIPFVVDKHLVSHVTVITVCLFVSLRPFTNATVISHPVCLSTLIATAIATPKGFQKHERVCRQWINNIQHHILLCTCTCVTTSRYPSETGKPPVKTDVAVMFCGPAILGNAVRRQCRVSYQSVRFHMHSESYEL